MKLLHSVHMKLTPVKIQATIGAALAGCVVFGILASVLFPHHHEAAQWIGTFVGLSLYSVAHFYHH